MLKQKLMLINKVLLIKLKKWIIQIKIYKINKKFKMIKKINSKQLNKIQQKPPQQLIIIINSSNY